MNVGAESPTPTECTMKWESGEMNNEVKNQMESAMNDEMAQAIAMLEKANSAFERLFGASEDDDE